MTKSKLSRVGVRKNIIPESIIDSCIKEYSETNISIPQLSKKFSISYRNLKYSFFIRGVKIEKRGNGNLGLTRSNRTKENISKSKIGKVNLLKRGTRYTNRQRLNIIQSQGNFLTDLGEFTEVDRFLLLKSFAYRNLQNKNEESILTFIRKFYYDLKFNSIYDTWLTNNKHKLFKPSIDHIVPISRGGSSSLENFQILTWFENRTKNNMTDLEWQTFKDLTHCASDLFMNR